MTNTDTAEDRLMTATEVAEKLLIHADTLKGWRYAKKGPEFMKLEGGQIRYAESAIEAYLTSRTVATA